MEPELSFSETKSLMETLKDLLLFPENIFYSNIQNAFTLSEEDQLIYFPLFWKDSRKKVLLSFSFSTEDTRFY